MGWKRRLHLWHRWLGIAGGVLILLWFASGIVMMYVPYPALTEQERMGWLEPIDGGKIAVSAWEAWQASGQSGVPDTVRLNTVAGRPAYHFLAGGRWHAIWADTGGVLRVSEAVIAASVHSALPGAGLLATDAIALDQWTFGRLAAHQPLQRVALDDAQRSVLYVSGRTGELVRDTTRRERGWNWAGAIIHWIYLTPLRAQQEPWRQVVMWTAAFTLLLALSGIVLGVQRLRLRSRYARGARSPYRGWQAWHHWLGLSMGTFTLTWLFSGWLSVTPFGWLSSPGITQADRLAFAGGPLARGDLSVAVAPVVLANRGVLELEWRRVAGTLYFSALGRAGRTLLAVHDGAPTAPIGEQALRRAAQAMRPGAQVASAALLTDADNYYYSHHRAAVFPVLRLQFSLPDETTFYIDPAQGQLADYSDRNSKWNRWLFNGLHQLDFLALMRTRPVWDVLVVTLCLGGVMLSGTGIFLGGRRLAMQRRASLRAGPASSVNNKVLDRI